MGRSDQRGGEIMRKPPYELIKAYCHSEEKAIRVRNYTYCIYKEKFLSSLEKHKEENMTLTKDAIETIRQTLLTEDSIQHYVIVAESIIQNENETIIEPYKKTFNWPAFGYSTMSSVLGGFIYSVLLLVLFWVAGSQILSWLQSLVSTVDK